jgi:nucleoside-diphosphate-sugar epimerase
VARVIELAREIAAGGALRRMVHVSTAYVSGRHGGCFGEEDLELGQEFRNTYERSKHEAEHLLRRADDLPVVVARPSIVVGHRTSGWTPVFNVIYWPIRAFERGLLEEVPARPESIADFVPVDYVTDGIMGLLEQDGAYGTYHLVAGEQALSAGELVELYSSLPDPPGRPGEHRFGSFRGRRPGACRREQGRCAVASRTPAREVLEWVGVEKPDPRDYLGQLIAYARTTGWGKRPTSRQASFSLSGV